MCEFEEFLFSCRHSVVKKKSYCHFARNDPNHQCFSVKVLKNTWFQGVPCDNCITAMLFAQGGRTPTENDPQGRRTPTQNDPQGNRQ
ncbi:hypothetical protein ColKHC_08335 [Colletotrichum higginsianum]|nr:hypothetical protein ColKHC_08335 [Colletotrichum higginsianum]